MTPDLDSLEAALGHKFADRSLLEAALIHSSYQSEHSEVTDNERHEFLGDAVLGLAVTTYLFLADPAMPEGQMAKIRAAVVSREELTGVAREIGLSEHILLGKGEESTGGRQKSSILADAMEAVIAAIYLDAGYEAAAGVIRAVWEERLRLRARRPGGADYKTRLQEILAASGLSPHYQVSGAGPDHAKEFRAIVVVDGQVRGEGTGPSKREAEQEAAQAALESAGGSWQPNG
jgi:ribonuclease-3